MKEITPEEKLLRLIRQKDKEKTFQQKKGLLTHKGLPFLFKITNLVLVSIVGVIFLFFLVDFLTMKGRISKLETSTPQMPEEQINPQPLQSPPSLPEIEELVRKKDIFIPDTKAPSSVDKETQKDKTGPHNLNLLGVITGVRPQAIIEDSSIKKTYFLNKGDSFSEYKVLQIKEGKVILEYRGEEIELKM